MYYLFCLILQTGQPLPKIVLDEWKSDTIFNFQGNIDRKCSDVSYVTNLPVTELVQNEEMDRLFVNEKESLEDSGEFVLKDTQVILFSFIYISPIDLSVQEID